MAKRKPPESWSQYGFDEFEKALAALEKPITEALHVKGCMSSGDTVVVEYFRANDVIRFCRQHIKDMRQMVLVRQTVAKLHLPDAR